MKIKIFTEETVTYKRVAIIELPQNTEDVEDLLHQAEYCAEAAQDVTEQLEEMGCTIIQDVDEDFCFPATVEVEIVDYVEVRE